MNVYTRFLRYFETCGGCVGLRDFANCKYAIPCHFVERMAERGEIYNSQDLFTVDGSGSSTIHSNESQPGYGPGIYRYHPAGGIGPCSAEPSGVGTRGQP